MKTHPCLPPLLALAHAQAPGVTFQLMPQVAQQQRALERGEVDLLVIPLAYCSPDHPTQALFEEQKITRLEYYGGLMEWHTRWTDNARTLYHLTSFRHSLLKRLAKTLAERSTRAAEIPVPATAAT